MKQDTAQRLLGIFIAAIPGVLGFAILFTIDPLIFLGFLLITLSGGLGRIAREVQYG